MVAEHRPQWASALRPLCSAADRAILGVLGEKFRPPAPTAVAEELTPETMLENLPSAMKSFRCHPDYTEAFLNWAFFEMEQVAARGRLIRSLVRDDGGQFLGWYVYYLKPRGAGWVIQVAASRYHGVALRSNGRVWTWGDNGGGALGDGTTTNRSSPTNAGRWSAC